MSKRVLITGAAGFLGMHAVIACLKAGYKVTGVDDLNDFTYGADLKFDRLSVLGIDPSSLAQSTYAKSGNFEFHVFDLADTPTVEAMILDGDFDLILHFATLTSIKAATLSPSVFFKANVNGLEFILEGIRALRGHRPRLICASSAAVYGDSRGPLLIEEDKNLLKPASIYATSKLMGEQLCEVYGRLYNIKSINMRIFNVYGPYMRPDTLVFKLERLLQSNDPLDLYNEGKSTHDFIYIDDFIEALSCLINIEEDKLTTSEIFNIGSAKAVSVNDVIKKMEYLSGKKLDIYQCQSPKGEIGNIISCNEKFLRYFKLAPRVSFDEGLDVFHRWAQSFLNNKNKYFKNL